VWYVNEEVQRVRDIVTLNIARILGLSFTFSEPLTRQFRRFHGDLMEVLKLDPIKFYYFICDESLQIWDESYRIQMLHFDSRYVCSTHS
jgi:hypothetical protein